MIGCNNDDVLIWKILFHKVVIVKIQVLEFLSENLKYSIFDQLKLWLD